MTTIHKRIKELRTLNGLSMEELAKAVGVKSWQTIQQWENGATAPKMARLAKVALALKTSTNYLMTGDDAPLRFRAVVTSAGAIDIPVMNAIGGMGIGRPLPENDAVVDHMRLTEAWVRSMFPSLTSPANLAVVSAFGDSMRPTFDDGDLLLVDTGVGDIKIDAVYVLALGDELYIKRLQRRPDGNYLMISDNKSYEPYVIQNGERGKFSVKGRVLFAWNGRRM